MRIEAIDPSLGKLTTLWYEYRPGSIDPVVVNSETGEVRIVPPEVRRGR